MKIVCLYLIVMSLFSLSYAFDGLPLPLSENDLSLPQPNGNVQLAVAPNGQAIAVWTNFPNQVEIQASYFYNGLDGGSPTQWTYLINNTGAFISPEVDLYFVGEVVDEQNNGTIALGSAPKVGIDNNGNPTIVWVSPNGQIVAARYQKNRLQNVNVLTVAGTANMSPTLAVNTDNTAVVVWIQAIPYQILARCFNSNPTVQRWSPTFLFMPIQEINAADAPPSNGTYPAALGLSNNPTGKGIMVWIDGPTGVVQSASFQIP